MEEGEGASGSVRILEKLQTEESSDREVEMDCRLVVGDGEVGLREVLGLTGVHLVEGNSKAHLRDIYEGKRTYSIGKLRFYLQYSCNTLKMIANDFNV